MAKRGRRQSKQRYTMQKKLKGRYFVAGHSTYPAFSDEPYSSTNTRQRLKRDLYQQLVEVAS